MSIPPPAAKQLSTLLQSHKIPTAASGPQQLADGAEAGNLNNDYLPARHTIDLMTWPGWVELESEPAFFNGLLKELGITGVVFHELRGFDPDALSELPAQARGLVFCFNYREPKHIVGDTETAEGVWFAKQVPTNACGTFAVLNSVTNIRDVNLGPRLSAFVEATRNVSPKDRGQAIDDLAWLRAAHNSFARESEIKAADLDLLDHSKSANKAASKKRPSDELDADFVGAGSRKRSKGNTGSRHANRRSMPCETIDEPAGPVYHYCAYIPVDGIIYMLDGVEETPQAVGTYDVNEIMTWLPTAAGIIQTRILVELEGDSSSCSLMAIIDDSLPGTRAALIKNISTLQHVEDRLTTAFQGLYATVREQAAITGIDIDLGISQKDLDDAGPSQADLARLSNANKLDELLELRRTLVDQQFALRNNVTEQSRRAEDDAKKAFHRRQNYTGFVRAWIEELADAGILADLLAQATQT